jgi:hypothetical protein
VIKAIRVEMAPAEKVSQSESRTWKSLIEVTTEERLVPKIVVKRGSTINRIKIPPSRQKTRLNKEIFLRTILQFRKKPDINMYA